MEYNGKPSDAEIRTHVLGKVCPPMGHPKLDHNTERVVRMSADGYGRLDPDGSMDDWDLFWDNDHVIASSTKAFWNMFKALKSAGHGPLAHTTLAVDAQLSAGAVGL